MDITHTHRKNTLVVFDFDGTVTSADSMIQFIVFAKGKAALYFSYLGLSFTLLLYKLGWINNETAKKELLKWHFNGMTEPEMKKMGAAFCEKIIPQILRPRAIERLAWHRKMGHSIAIVSSSLETWLKPWCDQNGYLCIATIPKFENGKFTGEFESPNCYGAEKVKRITAAFHIDSFEYVYAYGDTAGDKEMLDFADMWYYKPFR